MSDDALRKAIEQLDIDFGYAVGNLKDDCKDNTVDKIMQLFQSHIRQRELAAKINKRYLTEDQASAIVKLINDEIKLNMKNGDGAYNTYWDNVKKALGYK